MTTKESEYTIEGRKRKKKKKRRDQITQGEQGKRVMHDDRVEHCMC